MKKPLSHSIGNRAESLLQLYFSDWICNPLKNDYGNDYHITVVDNEKVTGYQFLVQLKGTQKLSVTKDYLKYDIETKYLKYYQHQFLPYFLSFFYLLAFR